MKRTLSLVLALVMVLGSFTTVFAAETATNAAAEFLAQEGVLLGNDDGDLMLEDNLERRNAVVLLSRLLGVEEEAAEFEAEGYPTWEDVDADPYYDGYLAWAEVNEYFQGDDEGNFNPRNAITAQEFAVVLLRALGYTDVEWDDVMDKAEELGLFAGVEVEGKDAVVRGQMANMIFNALIAEDGKLADKLGIELPVPAELEVVSVKANNLKEVEVVFNQEVDKETVVDANVKVKDVAGTVVLKDDGVTAVITVGTKLENQKEYTLVVDKVKAATGVEAAKAELKFKAFDATLPEALSVEVTGPRNLTITFSEPIVEGKGVVTVKQDKATLGNSVKVSGNKADVTVYTNFVEGKEYEVTVTDFQDYAEYKNIINVLTFTYEKDVTPPVATIEKAEQTYVIVSFNKPVKGVTADKFYHTFTAWISNKVEDLGGNRYKVFFDGGDAKAIPAGSTLFGIVGKDVKDNWGNALGNQEFTINTTADRVAPEVKEIKVEAEDQLKVIFTKDVKDLTRSNVEILDAEGKKIDGLYVYTPEKVKASEYTIKFSQKLAGKTITVSIKDVKDTTLYENLLSLHTELVEITDKSKPVVSKVYFELELKEDETDKYSKKDLFVVFNESVDPETALTASNYALVYPAVAEVKEGDVVVTPAKKAEVVILTQTPSYDTTDSRVKLPLTDVQAHKLATADTATVKLQIINVKDLANNAILPVLNDLEGSVANTKALSLKETASLTNKNTIVLKFNDLLSGITQDAFTVTVDNYAVATAKFGINVTNNSATTVEITVEDGFGTDISRVNSVKIAADKGIKNSFGVTTEGLTVTSFTDKVKPEIVKDGVNTTVGSKEVKITFSEAMKDVTFSTLSFEVEGKKVVDRSYADKVLTITVDEAFTNLEDLRVIYRQNVADDAGNLLNLDLGKVVEGKVNAAE